MNLFFLLLHLTSTVQGGITDETPPAHEMEEEDNITFSWDSMTQTDMSLTNMICFLLLRRPKVLYEIINGAEVTEFQDERFAGRVHCDREALREGHLRLHLSRLRTEDSGTYRCDLATGYNQKLERWELKASVNFVLNVTKTSNGDISASVETPKPGHMKNGVKLPALMAAIAVIVVLCLAIWAVPRLHGGRCKVKNMDGMRPSSMPMPCIDLD
ncbi:PREDICTED: uncharacterized protein LOC107089400 [Cyprinodon variegatus]|uniref:uncharacterized protein LOC107089400 n=1 Tax=Cyprinodon variegatus TaxID=28743 RepID=UPI000742CA33|nr:PREDICTED: uncharacterized protein LOC107089400 [Cyprinodon variegatus]